MSFHGWLMLNDLLQNLQVRPLFPVNTFWRLNPLANTSNASTQRRSR